MSTQSKVERAKQAQGYTTVPKNCGNCGARKFEMVIPAWMMERDFSDKELYAQEKNQRYGIGGFAVKRTATCNQWCAQQESGQ